MDPIQLPRVVDNATLCAIINAVREHCTQGADAASFALSNSITLQLTDEQKRNHRHNAKAHQNALRWLEQVNREKDERDAFDRD